MVLNQKSNNERNAVNTYILHLYTSMKDQMNKFRKSCVVYQFCYPGCNSNYTGKTEQNLRVRLEKYTNNRDRDHFSTTSLTVQNTNI